MRLKKKQTENFSERSSKTSLFNICNFKKCQVADHFVREGIARQTVYNALNQRKNVQSILCDTHIRPPSSRTSSM
jgi:hypothetical protein